MLFVLDPARITLVIVICALCIGGRGCSVVQGINKADTDYTISVNGCGTTIKDFRITSPPDFPAVLYVL